MPNNAATLVKSVIKHPTNLVYSFSQTELAMNSSYALSRKITEFIPTTDIR